ncbi:MAG: right-handed parallel beta-helix repeat-containing protein [Candidatus Kariarchaeaceae archaeon]|jgi:parallel beta-helix repeat protein
MKSKLKIHLLILLLSSSLLFNFSQYASSEGTDVTVSAYVDHEPIRINSDSDFTSDNGIIGGSGTETDPYIIQGWNITTSGEWPGVNGIFIAGTTAYFVIRNCWIATGYTNGASSTSGIRLALIAPGSAVIENNYFSNNYAGILLQRSSNNSIVNNTAIDNIHGIYLWRSSNNSIVNNTAIDNRNGIYLELSSNNSIVNNTAIDNIRGIFLRFSSNYNSMVNNIVNSNFYGIWLFDSSNYNSIVNNAVSFNSGGIIIYMSSNYNSIVNNIVNSNANFGIHLEGFANDNIIYHNSFFNSEAFDYSTNNIWYSSTLMEGNWWGDYSGSTSYYTISGPAGALDLYPLNVVNDNTSPVIDNPVDETYILGLTGNIIAWTAVDETSYDNYTIYRNGTQIETASWTNNTAIKINIDGLAVGVYDYTIIVADYSGNTIIDIVTVIVTPPDIQGIIDYIYNIPDYGFTANPDNQKAELRNKLMAAQNHIENLNFESAIRILQNDVRTKFDGEIDGKSGNDWILWYTNQLHLTTMIDGLITYLVTLST